MRSACSRNSLVTLFTLALAWPALAGCASEGEALEKRLAKLQEEVTRIQSQTDRMSERLDAVELRQSKPRSEERVASTESGTVGRPKLKVVRVQAGGDAPPPETIHSAPDDGAPRVLIQGEGKALESRTLPGSAKPKSEPVKKPEPAKPAPK